MSNDSDVYVYPHVDGFLECMCGGYNGRSYTTRIYSEMIEHLGQHAGRGDRVPARALRRLRREGTAFGDTPEERARLKKFFGQRGYDLWKDLVRRCAPVA